MFCKFLHILKFSKTIILDFANIYTKIQKTHFPNPQLQHLRQKMLIKMKLIPEISNLWKRGMYSKKYCVKLKISENMMKVIFLLASEMLIIYVTVSFATEMMAILKIIPFREKLIECFIFNTDVMSLKVKNCLAFQTRKEKVTEASYGLSYFIG